MTPELQTGIVLLTISGGVGWALSTHQTLIQHSEILKRLDKLITLMLEDRLNHAQDKEGSNPTQPDHSRRRDQRSDPNQWGL